MYRVQVYTKYDPYEDSVLRFERTYKRLGDARGIVTRNKNERMGFHHARIFMVMSDGKSALVETVE